MQSCEVVNNLSLEEWSIAIHEQDFYAMLTSKLQQYVHKRIADVKKGAIKELCYKLEHMQRRVRKLFTQ